MKWTSQECIAGYIIGLASEAPRTPHPCVKLSVFCLPKSRNLPYDRSSMNDHRSSTIARRSSMIYHFNHRPSILFLAVWLSSLAGYSLGSRGRPSGSWFSDSRVVTVSFPFRMSVSFAFRSRFVPTPSPFRSYFVPAYPPPLLETLLPLLETLPLSASNETSAGNTVRSH